jgi:hypothetical protein
MTISIDLERLNKSLQEVIDKFAAEATLVDEFIDPVVQQTGAAPDLKTHLLLYGMMDYIKDVCEALTKMCNKNMPTVAERAEKIMTQQDFDSIEFMGKHWSVAPKDYIDVNAALKPTCVAWLKAHPFGSSLVAEGYHPASFGKFIKEQYLDKGDKDKLPAFVNVFTKKELKTRKVRGS